MIQSLLFSVQTISSLSDFRANQARTAIEKLTHSVFTEGEPEAIALAIYNANAIGAITIDTANILQALPEELKVEISDITASNGKRLVDGVKYAFTIPFTGNRELLKTKPNGITSDAPYGEIGNAAISFYIQKPVTDNIEESVSRYQVNLNKIVYYTTVLNTQVSQFNESLQASITTQVNQRKAMLDKIYEDAEMFSMPID